MDDHEVAPGIEDHQMADPVRVHAVVQAVLHATTPNLPVHQVPTCHPVLTPHQADDPPTATLQYPLEVYLNHHTPLVHPPALPGLAQNLCRSVPARVQMVA